ncbi:MAG: hypothetical protein E7513_01275 [Ruminococcaceae bacterium]|nr:hypothetical protein [Oscillospiraceae bacterium]
MRKTRGIFVALIIFMTLLFCSSSVIFAATSDFVKITKQPVSVAVPNGYAAKVTVSATGTGLKYNWYYKSVGETEYSLTKSFTGNSYSVEMNNSRDGRKIYCVITDKQGNSVKSNTVTISKGGYATITKQPVSVSAPNGYTAKVTVSATGNGLKYQWYYKNAGDSKYSLTKTFTGNYYSVKMNNDRNGRKIYCKITDKYGKSVKSTAVTISKGGNVKITKQPTSVTVLGNSNAKVTVSATGNGLKYKWYYKNDGASKFALTTSFTGNTYSVKMNNERDGRKLYCKITDKYGKSVTTKTVTISMGEITKQPESVSVALGATAKTTISATGDGLKYKWYYKNAGEADFSLTTSFTGKTYSVTMNEARDGRMIYCMITDKYGNSVKTRIVTLSLSHKYDSGVITKQPTCSALGEKVYTCEQCSKKRVETIDKIDHNMGEWVKYKEATVYTEGIERQTCSMCTYYIDRATDKLKPVCYITVNTGDGESYSYGVGKNGIYNLSDPSKIGYTFKGWKDSNGDDFGRSGVINDDVEIFAQWDIEGTNTLKELIQRTDAGVDTIVITSDIIINQPIYISYETTIYADGNYTLKRDSDYDGDIFVVGFDRSGKSSILLGRKGILSLGGSEGMLTIDGNMDKTNVDVVGSAVFVSESSILNIFDNVKIANNNKIGNDRALKCITFIGLDSIERAGGAAVLNMNGTVNMYGGVLENNSVATEYTTVTNEDGTVQSKEIAGCGGAIFNYGTLKMYGGTVANNESLRGGGIYNGRFAYLFAGEVSDNLTHTYGGGLSTSSSLNADTFIGSDDEGDDMVFSGNHSIKAGGALYSNTSSPIIIYGNTRFENNRTDSSGGAIYTAGSLTISDASFSGNKCEYSGGAIYHHYAKAEFERRHLTVTDCEFDSNQGSLGGAIVLSADSSVGNIGTYANITDSDFNNNQAYANTSNPGNGGAIYVTRNSDATIDGCNFTQNKAANSAGALAVQSSSNVELPDCTFIENSAVSGGAIYTSSDSYINMTNLVFDGNSANFSTNNSGGNGGAVYISGSTVTLDNVDFYNNSADNNAGGIYQGDCDLNIDSTCEFSGNSAGNHAGAIYLTYKTNADGSKDGSKLTATDVAFENNTAQAGGAVSIRSACEAVMNNTLLKGNSVTADGYDAYGGGAIYVGFGDLTLNNVNASGNNSVGYGGVVNSVGSTVNVVNGIYENNSAASGGVFNATSNSTVTMEGTVMNKNKSTATSSDGTIGGGAVNITGGSLTVTDVMMDNNSSGYYGAAIHGRKATVKISGDSSATNSTGTTGGALYFRESCNVTIDDMTISNNTAKSNGVVYINGGKLNMNNITASGNKAGSGGVIYTSGASTQVTLENCTWSENFAKNGGVIYMANATVKLNDFAFSKNTANNAGAIYNKEGNLELADVTFTDNVSEMDSNGGNGHGGAITLSGAKLTTAGNIKFIGNAAENHGGAVYVTYIKGEEGAENINGSLDMTHGIFENNKAMGGGAVSVRTGCEATFDGTSFTNNSVTGYADKDEGDGEGGGAIYVGYGSLNLNNVTFSNNKSSGFGGAVDTVKSTVTVVDSTFIHNEAASGGAIYSLTGSDISLSNVELSRNISTYDNNDYNNSMGGGAVNISGGSLDIIDTIIDANETDYYGGAILTSNTKVDINKCTVKNSIGATGAALFFKGSSIVTVTDTDIVDNVSNGNGVVYMNNGTMYMTNVTASNNKANNGGVFYTSNPNTRISAENSTFTNNTATSGGVIYSDSATVEFINGEMSNNIANNGGAVYSTNGNIIFDQYTLKNNNATKSGGAINANGGNIELKNTTLTENTSTSNGGAVYAYLASVTLNDSLFSLNNANNGGAIDVVGGALNAAGNSEFTENTAANHGGAVYVTYANNDDGSTTPAIMTMNSGLFEDNCAQAGGAISSRTGCEVYLTGTQLNSNSASGTTTDLCGGAIYSNNNTLQLSGVIMNGNSTGYYGGAVTARGASVVIDNNCQFVNNTGVTGVAVYFRDGGTYELTDVSVTNNIATANGSGVVYITNGGTLDINRLTASGNVNNNGGVIYSSGTVAISVENSNLNSNTAWNYGGAIDHRSSGSLTVSNTYISNNTAKYGGAMNTNSAANIYILNSQLIDNSATEFGGAVYANGTGTINISDNSIFNNNTSKSAGAIYLDKGASAIITDATLEGNTSSGGDGGAILVLDSTTEGTATTNLSLTNVTLKNNVASAKGGAISTDTSSPNLMISATNCDFSDNASLGAGGGAVEIQNGNCASATDPTQLKIIFSNCTFTGNTAKTTGGAIEIRTNSCVLVDGITATMNISSDNGGVIYVTSNYSRLYLDGTVTIGENTSKNGNFIYLYNNAYTNPPKIYTTHNSTAAWYSEVKGNRTNVVFDLTTLP